MNFADLVNESSYLSYSGGCGTCPKKLVNYVSPSLRDTKLILVGTSPRADDVAKEEMFSSQDQQYLIKELKKRGISEYSVTNIVKCATSSPTEKEISCCMSQYTTKEIQGYPLVVLVGSIAIDSFFPDENVRNLRGNIAFHPDYPGQKFYSIYSPGYIRRHNDADLKQEWNRLLNRLARIYDQDYVCEWETKHEQNSDLEKELKNVLKNKQIVVDIETNSLKSYLPESKIKSLAICTNDKKAIFCHEKDLKWNKYLDLIGEVLQDSSKIIIGHNLGFDVEFLERKLNIVCTAKLLDTMCLYYLSRQEIMPSLKYLTSTYLDGYKYLIFNPDSCEDIDQLSKYNCEDVVRTSQLVKQEIGKLTKNQKKLLFSISSPSGLALQRVSSNGFLLDLELCKETETHLHNERLQIFELWKKHDSEFNPDKHTEGDGLIWYLHAHKKLPVLKRTKKTHKPSTDKNVLNQLHRETKEEFLKWLLRLKTIDKFESTYVKKYLHGDRVDHDGRVHASYTNTKTKTGRSSSFKPNNQNISRDDTLRRTEIEGLSHSLSNRKLFTVPKGKVLLHSDVSQFELRILMSLAKDPLGLKAYKENGDLHWQTAELIAAGEGRKATSQDRTYAKPVNFGLAYTYKDEAYTLKNNAKYQYGLDISTRKAQKYSDAFFQTYKNVRPWQLSVIKNMRENNGVVETSMGHRRYYPDYNSLDTNKREAAEREAINLMCQSPAGYLTLWILYLTQQQIRKNNLEGVLTVGTVHDSILTEVPERLVPDVVKIIQQCTKKVEEAMSGWFLVPLVMDFERGRNWSELEPLDPDVA